MRQQLIRVDFVGATDTKGSRYKARGFGRQHTVSADYSLDPNDNALRAAQELLKTFPGRFILSDLMPLETSRGFLFVVPVPEIRSISFTVEE